MSLINKKKEFKIISDVITSKSNIIDIGCSDGSLIAVSYTHLTLPTKA